jgi:hypothetical protein
MNVRTALNPADSHTPRLGRALPGKPEAFEDTLKHLYVRKATLEDLIRSLEIYRQSLEHERNLMLRS